MNKSISPTLPHGLEVLNCSLGCFQRYNACSHGAFHSHMALHCCCMTVLTLQYHDSWTSLMEIGFCCWLPPGALLPPISLKAQTHSFTTCLDLLRMWSFSSALVSGSSDHLLSCCGFFCSMPISRSLKYPRSPWSRHSLLHPKLAAMDSSGVSFTSTLCFPTDPRVSSTILHISNKLFDSSVIILHLPPRAEAAASCCNPCLPTNMPIIHHIRG